MLKCAVKFCGGCNPRYDRGAAYKKIRGALSDKILFSYPEDGESYDILLIIKGCTGCPYLYEEINADRRVVVTDQMQLETLLSDMRNILSETQKKEDK